MLSVTVKITGDKETVAKIKKLGQSLYMLKSSMNDIGEDLEQYYENQGFASQGGVFGNRWPSLNRQYALRKAKRYPGRSPLIKTGTMMRSFKHQANQTSVTIGNTADYFKYHQSTKEPRTKIPRRQMIGVNSAVKAIVQTNINTGVREKIKQAGL